MKKPKVHIITDDLYQHTFLFLACSVAEAPKALARMDPRLAEMVEFYANAGGATYGLGDVGIITLTLIWVNTAAPRDVRVVCAAHEALHASSRVLRQAGLRLTNKSEEAFTYHHSWLLAKLLELMK
jgi:hypothetical protein